MGSKIRNMDLAAGTAHTNSTTETSLARKSFAAGELTPGKIYEFDFGAIVSATNSTDTLTMAVRFGTSTTVTSNTAVASSSAVDVANDDTTLCHGYIHVQTATRAVLTCTMSEPDAIGTIRMAAQGPVVLTIAADTAYYLDVTADWSVNSASNVVASSCFAVWEHTQG